MLSRSFANLLRAPADLLHNPLSWAFSTGDDVVYGTLHSYY